MISLIFHIITAALFMLFLSACSNPVPNVESKINKDISKMVLGKGHNIDLKTLNIMKVYRMLSPNKPDFHSLISKKITHQGYIQYRVNLKRKAEKIQKIIEDKALSGARVIYKRKVIERRKSIHDEWGWGNRKNISYYYDLFENPEGTFEYKIAYQIINEKINKDNDKPTADSEKKVKNSSTENNIVLYFYRTKNDHKFHVIEPEVLVKSIYK